MTKLFTPSSTDLLRMVSAAEAKFTASRAVALRERAEAAFRANAAVKRETRQHDMRRHVNAGSGSI